MTTLLVLIGTLIVGLTVFDVITTTVSLGSGAGPVTRTVARSLWGAGLRAFPTRHAALRRTGIAVLLLSIVTWLLLIWAGWTTIFTAAEHAVVDATTGAPATLEERIYFAGYTILTLGNGDYRPDGPVWRVATVLATATGFAVVTLAITYLVPVVSAATQKRQLAKHLHALGPSPQQLLAGGWDGAGFGPLGRDLGGLVQVVLLHQQRHHTYPVLHYFHSGDAGTAAPLRLAALDEALTILQHGVAADARPDDRRLDALRAALTGYLDTVVPRYATPAAQPPPPPDLTPLREVGISTVADDELARALANPQVADRRRRLLGVVHHDAWTWDDVTR